MISTCLVSLKDAGVFLDRSLSEPEASSELLPVDDVVVTAAAAAAAEAWGAGDGFLLRFSRSLLTEAAAIPARSFLLPPRPTGSLTSGSGVPAGAKPLTPVSVLTGTELEAGREEASALFRSILAGPGLLRSDGGSNLI